MPLDLESLGLGELLAEDQRNRAVAAPGGPPSPGPRAGAAGGPLPPGPRAGAHPSAGAPEAPGEAPGAPGANPDLGIDPDLHVDDLLSEVATMGGSDLHLTAGRPPSIRVDGAIRVMEGYPELTGADTRRLVYAVLTQRQRERFEAQLELDASHSVAEVGRFRVNVFLQRDQVGSVMRVIPHEVAAFDTLGLPEVVGRFGEIPRGLVLVTGPTGSGKSTTLASVIDIVNRTRPVHIMTVEDPIEFVHPHRRAVVNQREVGEDTQSFARALKHVLR
ncbi:MAG: type IV pilus twitching motility protein PilT, partial [Acidimicrobiales bacterium]